MSQKHLDALRICLEQHDWVVVDVEPGTELDISAVWVVEPAHSSPTPPADRRTVRLVFEGMGDLDVLPIEQSYGCYERGRPANSVYFARRGQRWRSQIDAFVAALGAPDRAV